MGWIGLVVVESMGFEGWIVERDWSWHHREHSYGRYGEMEGIQLVVPVEHNMGHIVCWDR